VFTITLPPQKELKPTDSAPADKSLTEWERVRKELRGEKVEGADKKPKEPTIADILIKVLAENGKHFSQLAPEQTVTIVVTFRQAEGAVVNPAAFGDLGVPQYGIPLQRNLLDQIAPDQQARSDPAADPNAGGDKSAQGGELTAKEQGKAKDSLLLGDLLYKQGKFAEAVDAYTAALKELKDPKDSDAYAETCRKLALTLLALDRTDQAQEFLEQFIKHKKEAGTAPPTKAAPVAETPTKLILSAPKTLLDQVGSGKMSLDEFKKQVTLEVEQAAGSK
jgi:tetratricopeptide (TPR) repeat protein